MPSSSSLSVLSSSSPTCLVAPSLSLCPRSETLPVEYLGGKPLCMNQYYQILSSCRVPGPKQDTVISFSKTKKPPMHITVVHNYQVGGLLPFCGEGVGVGRAKSQLLQHTHPCVPRNKHALGISTRCLARPQPEDSQEGQGPAQPGESNSRTSSHLTPVAWLHPPGQDPGWHWL